jgi:hypothetical protein
MLRGPNQYGVDRFERTGLVPDLDSSSFNEDANNTRVDFRESSRKEARRRVHNAFLKLLAPLAEDL